jgi:hypothetical protein
MGPERGRNLERFLSLRADDRSTSTNVPPSAAHKRKEDPMFDRLRTKTAVATVASLLAALGVGGIAVAQDSGSGAAAQSHQAKQAPAKSAEVPGQESNAPDNSPGDRDNVQAGDQNGSDQETNDGSDGEQSSSELSGNDGSGGHADEPGNPGADHEASGQE